MKKILSLMLAVILAFGVFSVSASAATESSEPTFVFDQSSTNADEMLDLLSSLKLKMLSDPLDEKNQEYLSWMNEHIASLEAQQNIISPRYTQVRPVLGEFVSDIKKNGITTSGAMATYNSWNIIDGSEWEIEGMASTADSVDAYTVSTKLTAILHGPAVSGSLDGYSFSGTTSCQTSLTDQNSNYFYSLIDSNLHAGVTTTAIDIITAGSVKLYSTSPLVSATSQLHIIVL